MTDVVVTSTPWSPPGGVVRLDQPGQKLIAAPGISQVTVLGGVYIPSTGVGAVIDKTIQLAPPTGFAAEGAVQCAAPQARINCEIDLQGMPKHGVQIIRYNSVNDPSDVNLDELYVYNNSLGPSDPNKVGFYHGVYFQDCLRTTGTNLRFANIKGGRALHFYPNARDSAIKNVSDFGCYGDVVFWLGSYGTVTGNRVDKLFTQSVGAKGVVEYGPNASKLSNTVDFVTVASVGYGYQYPVTANVPLAKEELVMALDNFVSQLHYTEEKTKQTHVYKALLALGGTWR
jgi:hypothetical protein